MNISIKKLYIILGGCLAFYFAIFASFGVAMVRNPYYRIIVEWSGFFILFALNMKKNLHFYPKDIPFLMYILIVAYGFLNGSKDIRFEIAIMIPFLFMFLLVRINNEWISYVFYIFMISYFIYAFFTYFYYFAPERMYYSLVFTYFPTNAWFLLTCYWNGWMAGITSHYSTNGVLLATGLIACFCQMLLYWQKDVQKKWIWSLLFVFMLGALLLTGKRGPLLFSLASIYVVFYTSMTNNQGLRLRRTMMILLVTVIIGFILVMWVPALAQAYYRFVDTFSAGDITLGRKRYWELAWKGFKSNPILGIGWGRFEGLAKQVFRKNADTHNVFLQMLCETGIVGFVVFLLMFFNTLAITVRNYMKMIKTRDKNDIKKVLLSWSLGYQIFVFLYCFTGNPFYNSISYMPYFFACAIAVNYEYNKSAKKESVHLKRVKI